MNDTPSPPLDPDPEAESTEDGGRRTSLRDIGRSISAAVLERVGRAASRLQESSPLPADLLESDEAYLVVFDAPGATASDIQVRFRDGAVLLRIDRFREFYEGFEMRFPGRGLSLDGRVELPADAAVDAEAATATLRGNGTVEVRLPKLEGADGTEVTVEPESDDEATAGDEPGDGDEDEDETEE